MLHARAPRGQKVASVSANKQIMCDSRKCGAEKACHRRCLVLRAKWAGVCSCARTDSACAGVSARESVFHADENACACGKNVESPRRYCCDERERERIGHRLTTMRDKGTAIAHVDCRAVRNAQPLKL